MRKSELAGVKGKQPDGSAETREVKTGCIFTQTKFDDNGGPIRDSESTTYFARLGSREKFSPLLYFTVFFFLEFSTPAAIKLPITPFSLCPLI
jgi:hypothetical protein